MVIRQKEIQQIGYGKFVLIIVSICFFRLEEGAIVNGVHYA
jgi:hypothetical protein